MGNHIKAQTDKCWRKKGQKMQAYFMCKWEMNKKNAEIEKEREKNERKTKIMSTIATECVSWCLKMRHFPVFIQ